MLQMYKKVLEGLVVHSWGTSQNCLYWKENDTCWAGLAPVLATPWYRVWGRAERTGSHRLDLRKRPLVRGGWPQAPHSASQPCHCCEWFLCTSTHLILTQVCERGANVIPTLQTGKLRPRGSDSRSRRERAAEAGFERRHLVPDAGLSTTSQLCLSLSFLKLIFTGPWLLYTVGFVSDVPQSESAIRTHIPSLRFRSRLGRQRVLRRVPGAVR